jgi:hypothetical protein
MQDYRIVGGFLVSATLFAAASAAADPMLDGTFTLGYTDGSSDVGDYSGVTLGFSSEIGGGAGFRTGIDVDLARFTDETDAEIDLTRLALEPRYHFASGFIFGAYLQRTSAEIGNAGVFTGLDGHIDSYGAVFGYEQGALQIDGYFGASEIDPEIPGVDLSDMGVSVAYDVSPKMHVSGQLARTRIEAGGTETDIDMLGVAATYEVRQGFSVFGAYGALDVSDTPLDANSISLGVGYDVSGLGNLPPATASLEYARSSADIGGPSEDIDVFRLGISFPIGKGASSVPLNSSARSFGGGVRTVLPSAVLGGF